jgi:ABC-type multidrug transport system fused ATPase/permease subunit
LREITNEIQNLQKAGAGIERIQQLYTVKKAIIDGTQPGLGEVKGPIRVGFEQVSFGYTAEELVLKNIQFDLKPGRVLGLLGRTGSGKTTTTRLLFRLYDVTQGVIRLNGQDIRSIPLHELRQKIGLVTQNVQLFRASIRDNLTFFDHSLSDERIMQVIDELELHDWYARLPKGLDTQLESGGGGLSAGESQLLAFARVFLKNPSLVLLDEASSRLDPATEQLIEKAVDKLLKNRTAIIIAHRLGTIMRADEIMILQDGAILEYDDFDQLSANPDSRFSQLLKTGGLKEVLA